MVNKIKYLEILTTDEGSKLIEVAVDIDSDSVCNSGFCGSTLSTSGSASKFSNCSERESNTKEFNDG
jgi:hypothetical protein